MKKHIAALDGLRGIAILLVLMTHLLPYRPSSSAAMKVLNGVAGLGWAGVDVFFVLSGFLITGILWDQKKTSQFYQSFYMRRTLRIMPLLLVLLFLCTEVFPHFAATQGSAPTMHRWMFWLMLSNILVTFRGLVSVGWLAPLWSLAVEEHFYLAWPAVIRNVSRRRALQVCAACVVVANTTRLWFVMHHNLLGSYTFTLSRVDDLALGAVAALLLRGSLDEQQLRNIAKRLAMFSSLPVLVIVVWRHAVILDPIMLTIGITVIGMFSMSLLLLAVLPGVAHGWKLVLSVTPLRLFGRYSYGLYLLHMPVAEILGQHHLLFSITGRLADVENLLLQVAVTFAVAALSFHFFESPFLKLKSRFEPETKRQRVAQTMESEMPGQAVRMEVHSL